MISLLLLLNTICILYLLWDRHVRGRLSFSYRATFWLEEKYGFDIYHWNRPEGPWSRSGKSVFGLNWRRRERIPDTLEEKRRRKRED